MERISDRHEGDLGGRLEPFAKARQVAVTVVAAPGTAHLAAAQHTAWMLVNLLARAVGIVTIVRVTCPPLVPVADRVIPLASRDLPLREALVAGGQAIGAVPVEAAGHPQAGDTVIITCGTHPDADAVARRPLRRRSRLVGRSLKPAAASRRSGQQPAVRTVRCRVPRSRRGVPARPPSGQRLWRRRPGCRLGLLDTGTHPQPGARRPGRDPGRGHVRDRARRRGRDRHSLDARDLGNTRSHAGAC